MTGSIHDVMTGVNPNGFQAFTFSDRSDRQCLGNLNQAAFGTFNFDTSQGDSIYGASTKVQPKSLQALIIIKN